MASLFLIISWTLCLGIIPRGIYKHKVVDLPGRAHLFSDESKRRKNNSKLTRQSTLITITIFTMRIYTKEGILWLSRETSPIKDSDVYIHAVHLLHLPLPGAAPYKQNFPSFFILNILKSRIWKSCVFFSIATGVKLLMLYFHSSFLSNFLFSLPGDKQMDSFPL